FDERGIVPNIVAELDDSALVAELGSAGAGLFAAPESILEDSLRERGLRKAGSIPAIRERYYAITIERRLEHPAVVAVAGAARRSRRRGRRGSRPQAFQLVDPHSMQRPLFSLLLFGVTREG